MSDAQPEAKRPRTQPGRPAPSARAEVLDLLATVGDRAKDAEATAKQISAVSATLLARLSPNGAGGDDDDDDDGPAAAGGGEGPDPETFDAVGNALLRCGTELPYKAGVYAALAGLLCAAPERAHSARLAEALGAAVATELTNALRDGQATLARRSLRYLAELAKAKVVSRASLVEALVVLLEAAGTEMEQGSRGANNVHARGEFLADVALAALPFCGRFLKAGGDGELEEVLSAVRKVVEVWMPNRWRAVAVGHAGLASEAFGELIGVVLDLMETGRWEVAEEVLPRYCERFEGELGEVPCVNLETFVLPKHSKKTRYTPPRFRLCLLSSPEVREVKEEGDDDVDVEMDGDVLVNGDSKNQGDADMKTGEVKKEEGASEAGADGEGGGIMEATLDSKGKERETPAVGNGDAAKADVEMKTNGAPGKTKPEKKRKQLPIDRYVLRQYVVDVLDNFVSEHIKGAERLLTMPMLVGANDVIVETLFSEMCATPTPTNPSIYYGSLFVDLCKVKDSRLPIKLLAAVEKMFLDSGSLEEEAFDRLTAWFSFHLSNFGYKWNWADWAVYADTDMVEKFPFRALFCRDVLDRMVRLSYRDRIVKVVPEEMHYFLPPAIGSGNPVRFNKDINGEVMSIVAGAGKQPTPVVKERLEKLFPSSTFDGDEKQANKARLVALIRALLQGAARTLSHFDTLIERYMELLVTMGAAGGVAARKAVTLEAGVFWRSSDLRRLYVLDKLSTHRVIDGLAILDYLFTDAGVDAAGETITNSPADLCKRLEESGIWELARLVFSRARSRLEGARAELTSASASAVNVTEGDVEKAEERMNLAKEGAQNCKTTLGQLVLLALRRLFMLSDIVLRYMGTAEEGKGVGEIFTWRALGMMLEIGRKHPDHVEAVLNEIRDETAGLRQQHIALQNAFDALEEIAGCDIAC